MKSAAPLALVPTVYPGRVLTSPDGDVLFDPQGQIEADRVGPVSYLGPQPDGNIQRVMMALSENVFDRLNKACDHVLRLDDKCDKIGSVTARNICLDTQMNTSYELPPGMSSDTPPEWDFEGFIAQTNHWALGCCTHGEPGPPNAAEHLKGKTANAMLTLPRGVTWCGAYVHETTGLTMRGLGNYMLNTDGFEMRWDVLCG